MGNFINRGNTSFASARRSEIYIDKTGLIAYTNKVIDTRQQFICVSRPRRFGKSMAAEMLAAYYSKARASSNVAVDYTLIKNVKKPNGAKPGFVVYDPYKTEFVTPTMEEAEGLSDE